MAASCCLVKYRDPKQRERDFLFNFFINHHHSTSDRWTRYTPSHPQSSSLRRLLPSTAASPRQAPAPLLIALSIYPPSTPSIGLVLSLSREGGRVGDCRVEFSDGDAGEDEEGEVSGDDDVDFERALQLDGTIPGSSDEFVKQVSSRAYDMRRNLIQTLESSSYDVLEVNPWRETSKAVYVLTHKQNQLCTMRTLRNRRSVFEDENEAMNYCNLLQGGGQGCEGVAEIESSSVFDLCKSTRALAVLFRKGRTPPHPERLQLNLRVRNHSLED
ncbi:hypothetical protein AKJ16_DCAP11469 [Drosera capensis]